MSLICALLRPLFLLGGASSASASSGVTEEPGALSQEHFTLDPGTLSIPAEADPCLGHVSVTNGVFLQASVYFCSFLCALLNC